VSIVKSIEYAEIKGGYFYLNAAYDVAKKALLGK
jgi:hypothetical protein